MKTERNIIFHGSHFLDFYADLPEKIQDKIDYVFKIVKTIEQVPVRFLKHVEGTEALFEIRVEFESNTYRIFCCFDQGNLVVLFNAFQKKSTKLPLKEIKLAETLKIEYFKSKGIKDDEGRNKKG